MRLGILLARQPSARLLVMRRCCVVLVGMNMLIPPFIGTLSFLLNGLAIGSVLFYLMKIKSKFNC